MGFKFMEELGTLIATLVEDRGLKKLKVNMIKGNVIRGFLKPVDNLKMRR